MKVSEISGALLDYWCARAEGIPADQLEIRQVPRTDMQICVRTWTNGSGTVLTKTLAYSTSWEDGGPLIERDKLELTPLYDMRNRFVYWSSQPPGMGHLAMEDENPLVAAMRAKVASQFGDEIPE